MLEVSPTFSPHWVLLWMIHLIFIFNTNQGSPIPRSFPTSHPGTGKMPLLSVPRASMPSFPRMLIIPYSGHLFIFQLFH
jgi:hypothetical protein